MLIRFTFNNVYSFGVQSEFSMIPNSRLKTLQNHIYQGEEFGVLKMAAIYGANGAGKSNLIKAIEMLAALVRRQIPPSRYKRSLFRLRDGYEEAVQLFAIEFIQAETPFYYAVEIQNGFITTEELYVSGLGKAEDQLVFERKTIQTGETSITFSKEFESDEKSLVLKSILLEEFVKPDKTILKLLAKRENPFLGETRKAYAWFEETLNILTPDTRPANLTRALDAEEGFKEFAEELIRAVGLGISGLTVEKKPFDQFILEQPNTSREDIYEEIDNIPEGMVIVRNSAGEEYTIVKDKEGVWVERLLLEHKGNAEHRTLFDLVDESDGTVRILDFVPAFNDLTHGPCVYLIDEIERSIHPSLIKQLIRNFSSANGSKGQVIFTTHESHLLDQDIFRQDEVWFVEKNQQGSSTLYSLNDFKEHKTIDIQKGYLSGRYGAIPFLANLDSLNWG
jgi:uncharacterized protein